MRLALVQNLLSPPIRDDRELQRYVFRVVALCVVFAVSLDVVNNLVFFADWATCIRSWCLTTFIVLCLALPIARTIGRAHLELFRAKSAAESLGRTDTLTGLPNRRAMMEQVNAGEPEILALVILDIDRFKRVNDTHGHLAGDAVISAVGRRMAEELGGLGMVARIGGEEFAVLVSNASQERVIEELERFRARLSQTPLAAENVALRVTISAGVAGRDERRDFNRLFADADRALYAAKRSGRNRICCAGEAAEADALRA